MTTPKANRRSIFQIGAAGGDDSPPCSQSSATASRHAPGRRPGCRHQRGGRHPGDRDLIEDSVATLAQRLAGHDAVVFSAGAHGTGAELTTAIDGRGLEKAATAPHTSPCRTAHARRPKSRPSAA